VTYKKFIRKLEKNKIEYTLLRFYSATYVEVGRFAFAFDGLGECTGGWIRNCGDDWGAEWKAWMALLNCSV
jgi:hypothetical protein